MSSAYFDYAAATPVDPLVLHAMEQYWTQQFYNPSALYLRAKDVRAQLDSALSRIASIFGGRASGVIPTSGATEANNLIIQGIVRQYPGSKVLVSAVEHDSILRPAMFVGGETFSVDEYGVVLLDALEQQITDDVVLISCMLVNNETGVLQPLPAITQIVARIRHDRKSRGVELPLYVHTDATQGVAYMDCTVSRLGVDALTCNGGKIYGPKGVGVLYLDAAVRLQPLLFGGGQSHGLRSGTENVAGILALATALELVSRRHKQESRRLSQLQTLFMKLMKESGIDFSVHGSRTYSAPHILSVLLPGTDNERVVMELDERGYCVATGSACSASSDMPSHVLQAMGIAEGDIRSTIRVSFGRQTTAQDVCDLVAAILSSAQAKY